jgi:hypothetical protein
VLLVFPLSPCLPCLSCMCVRQEGAPAEEEGEMAVGHSSPAKVPRCKYHNAPGGCKRGDACRFVHGPKRRAPKEGVGVRGPVHLCRP